MLLTLISLTAVETSCKWPDLKLRFIWDIICKRQMSFILLFKNNAAKFLSARKNFKITVVLNLKTIQQSRSPKHLYGFV